MAINSTVLGLGMANRSAGMPLTVDDRQSAMNAPWNLCRSYGYGAEMDGRHLWTTSHGMAYSWRLSEMHGFQSSSSWDPFSWPKASQKHVQRYSTLYTHACMQMQCKPHPWYIFFLIMTQLIHFPACCMRPTVLYTNHYKFSSVVKMDGWIQCQLLYHKLFMSITICMCC